MTIPATRTTTETRLQALSVWLCNAAAAGLPCPTNKEIADRFGIKSTGTASRFIDEMERRGEIDVVRMPGVGRIVTIRETGLITAPPHGGPVDHTGMVPPAYLSDEAIHHQARKAAEREAFLASITVSRDPCRVCGVRGDIGCKHNKVAA